LNGGDIVGHRPYGCGTKAPPRTTTEEMAAVRPPKDTAGTG